MPTSSLPAGEVKPPNIRDGSRYACTYRVPVVDCLERVVTRHDHEGRPYRVTERLDEDQIRTILANTQDRAARGEYGPIFLGHTNDDGAEIDQPPLVGYLADYELGQHNGNTAILATMCLDRAECAKLKLNGEPATPEALLAQFPRRSGEIVAMEKPHGFIDSVAMMKRTRSARWGWSPT